MQCALLTQCAIQGVVLSLRQEHVKSSLSVTAGGSGALNLRSILAGPGQEEKREREPICLTLPYGHRGIIALAFSGGEGEKLATVSTDNDHTVTVWDWKKQEVICRLVIPSCAARFFPGSRHFLGQQRHRAWSGARGARFKQRERVCGPVT